MRIWRVPRLSMTRTPRTPEESVQAGAVPAMWQSEPLTPLDSVEADAAKNSDTVGAPDLTMGPHFWRIRSMTHWAAAAEISTEGKGVVLGSGDRNGPARTPGGGH